MRAELRFHIEAYAEDLMRSGLPRSEAMRRARVEFAGIEQAKEECCDARGLNFVESLLQDLCSALRTRVEARASQSWPFQRWRSASAPPLRSSAL
jgi:hypothetical protein